MIAIASDTTPLDDRPTIEAAGKRFEHRRPSTLGGWRSRLCETPRPEPVCRCGAYRIRWAEIGDAR